MMENQNEEQAASIEQLEVGKPLLEYMQQQFGWKFREIAVMEVPVLSADAQSILGAKNDDIDRLVMLSTEMLIIEDQFGADHGARRNFFKQVLGSHGSWIKKRSLLSGNNLLASIFIMEDLLKTAQRKKLTVNFNVARVTKIGEELSMYRDMDFDGKVAFAQKMRHLIHEFLDSLSQAKFENLGE